MYGIGIDVSQATLDVAVPKVRDVLPKPIGSMQQCWRRWPTFCRLPTTCRRPLGNAVWPNLHSAAVIWCRCASARCSACGSRIRGEQVADLLKFIATTSGDAPVVIAGDFNAQVDAGDLSALRQRYGDSYGSVHVNNELAHASTLNRHYYDAPPRIDHIFFQQDTLLAREARLLFDQPYAEGRWASDHYGVWTRLQFAP